MSPSKLQVQANLSFSSTTATGAPGVAGTIKADGATIDVVVDGPVAVTSPSFRRLLGALAHSLAKRKLRVVMHTPQGVVAALGNVRAPRWQRLLTRSPHIQLGYGRVRRRLLIQSLVGGRGLPGAASSVPPPTLFPLAPTVYTLGPRRVTTTHDPRGGGRPRVSFALSPWPHAGEVQRVEYLTQPRTTFGSSPECDVRVEGLEPVHAVIERTEHDEYVLTHIAPAGTSMVAGIPASESLLRTGAGIQLGWTRLTYLREEFADHGRPYGGRLGGEIGRQRPQPAPMPRRQDAAGRPRTNQNPGRYYP